MNKIIINEEYMVEATEIKSDVKEYPFYDIWMVHNGKQICKLSSGCVGANSRDYWIEKDYVMLKRAIVLHELLLAHPEDKDFYTEWLNTTIEAFGKRVSDVVLKEVVLK